MDNCAAELRAEIDARRQTRRGARNEGNSKISMWTTVAVTDVYERFVGKYDLHPTLIPMGGPQSSNIFAHYRFGLYLMLSRLMRSERYLVLRSNYRLMFWGALKLSRLLAVPVVRVIKARLTPNVYKSVVKHDC